MTKLEGYNNLLYKLKYIEQDENKYLAVWLKLIKNKRVLKGAIDNNCIYIIEGILLSYNIVDRNIYQKLINKIYSSVDIANIRVNKKTLLELSFVNYNLELNKVQRKYIIKYSNLNYHVLKNQSFTLSEKRNMIYKLNNVDWDLYLDNLEKDLYKYILQKGYSFNFGMFYEYTFLDLVILFKNKKFASYIWQEIKFLEQLHIIRPQQWELGNIGKGKVKIITI